MSLKHFIVMSSLMTRNKLCDEAIKQQVLPSGYQEMQGRHK